MSTLSHFLHNPRARILLGVLPRYVSMALLILLGVSLANSIWLVATPANRLPIQSQKTPTSKQANSGVDHAGQLARLNVFGTAFKAKKDIEKPQKAPETRLNLKLRGVFALKDEEKGLALIADGNKPEKMYLVNDTIARGTTLAAVYADRIMLKIRGRFETLKLPETQGTGLSYSAASRALNSAGNPKNKQPANNAVANQANKTLKTYRREFLRDPQQVTKHVAFAQVSNGYRVSTRLPHPAIDQIGLQNGDVVTAVNGILLNTQANGLKAFQAVRSAKQVTVDVIRNGQPTTLNVSF